MAGEMLGPILVTLHNLTYYQRLLAEARAAIAAGWFATFFAEREAGRLGRHRRREQPGRRVRSTRRAASADGSASDSEARTALVDCPAWF